jgi:predicted secreted protein
MNPATWIAIYMPIFILLFVIVPRQNQMQAQAARKMMKKRRLRPLNHELIKKFIGKVCKITTGSYGTTTSGKIIDVKENWIELETQKGIELMNADFVQNIKVKN